MAANAEPAESSQTMNPRTVETIPLKPASCNNDDPSGKVIADLKSLEISKINPLLYYPNMLLAWILRMFVWPFKKQAEVSMAETNGNLTSMNKIVPASAETTQPQTPAVLPLSVNYHFTRQCNFKCGFCFHTAKSSFVMPLDEAMRGLRLLKEAGMEKINFSGGEPFIHQKGRFLGQLVRYCKVELGLSSVSIVSNGSLITENWFRDFGEYLDILAISCDSFDIETNNQIGRKSGLPKNNWDTLQQIRGWCRDYKVAFKLNTVVNTANLNEDMTEPIKLLNPVRWKVFQCLIIDGENQGAEALRNAQTFVISDEEFQTFLDRHSSLGSVLVPESNEKMRDSYLILDEKMRFLDCTGGEKKPSPSLLDVGVKEAIKFSGFDEKMFFERGGKYTWTKDEMDPSQLEW